MRDMDLENSVITRTMRDGIDNEAEEPRYCPICGEEADELAVNPEGEIIGCRECVEWKRAWDVGE